MSTRCQIKLFDSGVSLYRHSDGYPNDKSGVLETIAKAIMANPFLFNRIGDDEYLAFRVPEALVSDMGMNLQETGFGLGKDTKIEIHDDIRYLYWITYETIDEKECFVVYSRAGREHYPTKEDLRFIIPPKGDAYFEKRTDSD